MATIAVIGLGHVGCVTACCLAYLGHRVWGVDTDTGKLGAIRGARSPFHEERLESMIQQVVSSDDLTVTQDIDEALAMAQTAVICVGTDAASDGGADLSRLFQVIDQILEARRRGGFSGTVVIRSTVPPGTCDRFLLPKLRPAGLALVVNPEFLREGSAVADFLNPSLLVLGGTDPVALGRIADMYSMLNCVPQILTLREAEMTKYACNAFHGLKIAFANEIGGMCSAMDIDGGAVMRVVCSDVRLNASSAYLKPAFAFGGYCLPKDIQALNVCASKVGIDLPLMQAILPSNAQHLRRAVNSVLALDVNPIGVYGISFKGGTDDVRSSPSIALIKELVRLGKQVRIFDPLFRQERPSDPTLDLKLESLMVSDSGQWLRSIHCVALTQPPDAKMIALLQNTRLPIVDLCNDNSIERARSAAAL